MFSWLQKNKRILALVFLYLFVNAVIAYRYAPWRDVAQAWLIARDVPLSDFFDQLSFEGHPALWYVLLMPFARLGLPYETIMVISTLLMTGGYFVFLKKSPFPWWLVSVIFFSFMGVYHLPTIARSYALAPLIVSLVALAYPSRHKRPVRYALTLFLLSQIHVLLCATTGLLMAFWTMEWLFNKTKPCKQPRHLTAFLIMLSSVLFLAVTLMPSIDTNQVVALQMPSSLADACTAMWQSFYDLPYQGLQFPLIVVDDLLANIALLPAFVMLAYGLFAWFRRAPKMALLFVVGLLWHLFAYAFLYGVSPHRFVLLLWQCFLCIWLTRIDGKESIHKKALSYRLALLLMILCALSYPQLYLTVQTNASAGVEESASTQTANYIKENLPDDALILANGEEYESAISAYLPKEQVYNMIRGNYEHYVRWDGGTMAYHLDGDFADFLLQHQLMLEGHTLYYLAAVQYDDDVLAMAERANVTFTEVFRMTPSAYEDNCILYEITLP